MDWRNAASAQEYAKIYASNLGRKYSSVEPDTADQKSGPAADGSIEQVFTTDEGPVVITTRGSKVFVAESFPLDLARELTSLILNAQGGGAMQMTQNAAPGWPFMEPVSAPIPAAQLGEPLSGGLVRFFSHCGVLKAAVDAELESGAAMHIATETH